MSVLRDLGERRLLRELIPAFIAEIGSDCAAVPLPGVPGIAVVATTDPVPEPAARVIGGDTDYYWMGWLLVVINASDLAAAGATPLAFLAALEAPASLPTRDMTRLLQGIADCCRAEGLLYVGGNLREGSRVTGVGTALGFCADRPPLTRKGASAGDVVVSIGVGGRFWADAFAVLAGGHVEKDASPLFRPQSQIRPMEILSQHRVLTAAMDNSDGLLPTLQELAFVNDLRVEVDLETLTVPAFSRLDIDPARLWLGWGDWNIITTTPSSRFHELERIARTNGFPVNRIGRCVDGAASVSLLRGGGEASAPRLESERFAVDSWFSTGISGYVELLKTVPLP